MNLTYGTYQTTTSPRLSQNPKLAAFIKSIFGYTNVGNFARFQIFKRLLNKVPTDTFESILDLGCGYGEYSFSVARALPNTHVIALDVDNHKTRLIKKIKQEQGINNITTHTGKIESLRDQVESFDFIYSVDVFEHIAPEEMPFKNCHRKLKKGGYLMVKMPNKRQHTILPDRYFEEHHDWLDDEHIGQVYDLYTLKKRFENEGFKIVHAAYADGWFARLGWEIWYLTKKMGTLFQLMALPLSKMLVRLDQQVHKPSRGNTIQVIGQKI